MSPREEVHRLVDAMPEEALQGLLESLKAGDGTDDEPLSSDDVAAIRRGLDDIQAGRVVARTEVRRQYSL
jgi:predicted transcriptional regulator